MLTAIENVQLIIVYLPEDVILFLKNKSIKIYVGLADNALKKHERMVYELLI